VRRGRDRRYAAWVHESDEGLRAALSGRGYTLDESTRAMGMSLTDIAVADPEIDLGPADWSENLQYLRVFGVAPGLLSGANPAACHILLATLSGENVATAIAFDHDRDCGAFNVSTLEAARRRASQRLSPRASSIKHSAAGLRRRACGRRRWPSACIRPSGSATWAASSTCRRRRASVWASGYRGAGARALPPPRARRARTQTEPPMPATIKHLSHERTVSRRGHWPANRVRGQAALVHRTALTAVARVRRTRSTSSA
jgi:hypothetical protein